MSNCKLCKKLVGSVSVAVVDTSLVINIPQANYNNCERLCLAVLQAVPDTATRGMPVVITIGSDTTAYQLVQCNGLDVTQEYIGQGNVYRLQVVTNTTTGVFKVLNKLCLAATNIASIPVATSEAGG